MNHLGSETKLTMLQGPTPETEGKPVLPRGHEPRDRTAKDCSGLVTTQEHPKTVAARQTNGRAVVGPLKATDTCWMVVTTGKRPYVLPYTASVTKSGALSAWLADNLGQAYLASHLRIVRVTATWKVQP